MLVMVEWKASGFVGCRWRNLGLGIKVTKTAGCITIKQS